MWQLHRLLYRLKQLKQLPSRKFLLLLPEQLLLWLQQVLGTRRYQPYTQESTIV